MSGKTKNAILAMVFLILIATIAYLSYELSAPNSISLIEDLKTWDKVQQIKMIIANTSNIGGGIITQTNESNSTGEKVPESVNYNDDTQRGSPSNVYSQDNALSKKTADKIPLDSAFSGKVTKIVDGDTLDIDNNRIRLALVNTPERGEAGYAEATAFTRASCPVGSTAMYDIDSGQSDGSYGRTIAKVWCFGHPATTPNSSLNSQLIKEGHAGVFQQFCTISEFGGEDWTKPYC